MIIVLFSIILSGPGENDPKSVEVWLHAAWLNLQTRATVVTPLQHNNPTSPQEEVLLLLRFVELVSEELKHRQSSQDATSPENFTD